MDVEKFPIHNSSLCRKEHIFRKRLRRNCLWSIFPSYIGQSPLKGVFPKGHPLLGFMAVQFFGVKIKVFLTKDFNE